MILVLSISVSGVMVRVLVNDGFMPERRETETLSVSLDMGVLSFNQVTLTETLLTTAVLRVILQMSERLVPAYKEPSGKVILMLGTDTKG